MKNYYGGIDWEKDFRKGWADICKKLKNSGHDLSKIHIVPEYLPRTQPTEEEEQLWSL